jgi:tape measure domain-containing protein
MATENFLYNFRAIDGTKLAFQSVSRNIDKVTKQGASLRRVFSSTFTQSIGGGAALASAGLVNLRLQFDQIQKTLDFATGSTEAGAEAFRFASGEARRLGLDLRATAKSYAQFAAAAKGTNLEGAMSDKVFSSVAQAAAVLQLSADDTRGALRALEQMISKGNVQAEELRQQLGERLPGAFQYAARAMGVTTQELNDMLENGEVLADDLLPKLADELNRTFGPNVAAAADSLKASLQRLSLEVETLSNTAAEGPAAITKSLSDFGAEILGGINYFLEWNKQLSEQEAAQQFIKNQEEAKARLHELGVQIANTTVALQAYRQAGKSDETMTRAVRLAFLTKEYDALAASIEKTTKAAKAAEKVDISKIAIPKPGPVMAPGMSEEVLKIQDQALKEAMEAAESLLSPQEVLQKRIEKLNQDFASAFIPVDLYSKALRALSIEMANLNPNIQEAQDLFESVSGTISANLSPIDQYAENVREFVEEALRLQEIDPEAFKKLGGMEAIQEAVAGMSKGLGKDEESPFKSLVGDMDIVFMRWDEGLDGMADAFSQAIQRMAADFLASRLVDALTGGFEAMGSGGAGFFSGFAKGLTGKAVGGTVMANRPYLVGEKGPELLYAGRSGTIVPNDQMGGGGLNYAPVVNISGGASEQDRAIFSAELRRQKAEIADMLARRRF